VLALATIAVLGVVLGGLTLARVRGDLAAGKAALQDARRALVAGRISDAGASFDLAGARFTSAAALADGAPGRLASWLPAFGHNVEAAAALSEAGRHLAAAGQDLTRGLEDLTGGLDDLTPRRGVLPLEVYAGLGAATGGARAEAATAVAILEEAPDSFLLAPIRDARWEALSEAREVARSLEAGDALLRGLPAFAGSEGPRRYLVLAQNPAELRGTGGIWGAYAILTLDGGRPTLSGAAPTQALADPPLEDITGVPDDYRRNYDEFGGAASWQNMNLTPDFPSAAVAALANYRAGEGVHLDGVIAADPFALRSMLRVTGPVRVPGTDVRVDAESVVAFTTNEAYASFPKQVERKAVLGAVSADVIGRFLAIDGKGLARIRALATAIGGGHLLVYSDDPAFGSALEVAGADGGFPATGAGDLASVTINNGSGNKVDFYLERHVRYEAVLAPDGHVRSTLEVDLRNEAPTRGPPRYVLGPFVEGLGPGDALPFVTGWCREPCQLAAATRDGEPIKVGSGTEGQGRWFRDFHPLPAGASTTIGMTWRASDAWEGDTSSGVYRLTFVGQPSIRPVALTVTVVAPPGTEVIWSNVPMTLDGERATWRGEPGPRLSLEVRFQAPTITRWWRNARRAFG
jgi:hypothetical protein